MDISPIFLSLKTALTATTVIFLPAIGAAYMVMRARHGKAVFDTVFTLPMVLPPTVVGFFLLLFFGKNHRVGAWFYRHGLSVVFSWNGAVIASAVVVFPLLYRTARSAFEQIDENLIYAGRTLGMSEWRIFWKIIFPNAVHGIAGGVVLAFARALGEFGATLMLAGNIPGKTQTAAIAVYSAMQNGNREDAYRWCLIMVLMSFAAILCLHLMTKKQVKKTGRN